LELIKNRLNGIKTALKSDFSLNPFFMISGPVLISGLELCMVRLDVAMKCLITGLLVLLILNACVLWLLLVGTLIKWLGRTFPIKCKDRGSQDAWQPSLPAPEHRRSGAGGSFHHEI
jgi:hypothetical protein